RRMAAERDDVGVGSERPGRGRDADDPVAAARDRLDRGGETELDAALGGERGDALAKLEAVAGLVARQQQAADELVADARERGLVADAAVAVEQLERDAGLAQHRDVAGA